ncbi:hypothetical protein NDU88_004395 [Pleurodeles waltl]|uniref:Uncharacterized protein n=1 Tax=Pleurodeles waltl TaxID=8319 RepID=A0AAV7QG21_PLEWA|nr:hypothetical protein NDU88_004395 [Pleurodeles waltl]
MFGEPGSTSAWVGDLRRPTTHRQPSHCLRRVSGRQDGPLDLAHAWKSGPAQAHSLHEPQASSATTRPRPVARPQAADAGGRVFLLGLPRNAAWSVNGAWGTPPLQGAAAYCCVAPQQLPLLCEGLVLSGRPQVCRRLHPADHRHRLRRSKKTRASFPDHRGGPSHRWGPGEKGRQGAGTGGRYWADDGGGRSTLRERPPS